MNGAVQGRREILFLRQVSKAYPGVVALDSVDFAVYPQEIIGLVGENGAGKSTLMKILIGLEQPDQGTLMLRGEEVVLKDPADAVRYGIGMVFQDGTLVPNLSIMENLFLCHEKGFLRYGLLSRRQMKQAASELLERVKLQADIDAPISEVPPAARQMVEIARLMWLSRLYGQQNPILILDEPTTVLTEGERDTLFSILKSLRAEASIILISHRLQEIVENSDRICILKDGKNVKEILSAEARIADIEQAMVGHAFSADRYRENEQREPETEVILKVERLSKKGSFEPISFDMRKGEIVSLIGLVGSGKEEICRCLNGLDKADSGSILLAGKRLAPGSPRDAVASGQGHIPIDRRSEGLALAMSVAENVNLLVLRQLRSAGLISPAQERRNAARWIEECRIKTPSNSTLCANLSGGNQQKTVIAKWLSSRVKLLMLDHPTRGVDVGAKDDIYRIIRKLAQEGIAMLIMCDTLDEDIGLSNRMLIMKDGRLVREVACPARGKPRPVDIIGFIV